MLIFLPVVHVQRQARLFSVEALMQVRAQRARVQERDAEQDCQTLLQGLHCTRRIAAPSVRDQSDCRRIRDADPGIGPSDRATAPFWRRWTDNVCAASTNEDGSTDLFIQHESPGKDLESNWLPAPADNFVLMMRMYWPSQKAPSIVDSSWSPPPVQKAK